MSLFPFIRPSLETLVFAGFFAMVCLAPLPLGGYRPLPWAINALAVSALLLLWSLARRRAPASSADADWWRLAWPGLAALGVLAWSLVQTLPLSAPGLGPFPGADWASPQWAEAGRALDGVVLDPRISVAPGESSSGTMRLATAFGVFLLAFHLGRSRRLARRFFRGLAAVALGYALYGLTMHLGGFDMVLWWDRWAYRDSVTATFVNRNHFATYAGLGLLCALAMIVERRDPVTGFGTATLDVVGLGEFIERHWFMLSAAVVIFLALVLSHSRAGLIATGFAVLVLFSALVFSRELRLSRRQAWALAGLVLGLLALVGGQTIERIGLLEAGGLKRDDVALIAGRALGAAPLLGYGHGAFADVFALHRDASAGLEGVWRQAHNDYLETALELGLPAALALWFALAWPVAGCLRGLRRRRRDRVYPAIGVAATALVGVHALVDFSMQTQGVALTYAAILGVAYAQSWSTASRPT